MRRARLTGCAAALALCLGCADRGVPPATPSPPASAIPARRACFRDATAASGISFVHQQGRFIRYLPETMAPGAALVDIDADGLLDAFLVQGSGPANGRGTDPSPTSKLYRQRGDDRFEDASDAAGVALQRAGMGCLATDLDNDGHTDLVVTAYLQPNAVFRNNGDGTFREAARELGLESDNRWNSFVTALDYDRDGLLDVYAGRYVLFRPEDWIANPEAIPIREFGEEKLPATMIPDQFPPQDKTLYHSRLPAPYHDATAAAGVPDAEGRGLGAVATDLDQDGWPDLFVANDASPCGVYRNRGGGRFEDIRRSSWGADVRGSMGIALSDYKGDGALALLVTHFTGDIPALYSPKVRRTAAGSTVMLLDRGEAAGLGTPGNEYVGWGCGFLDLDRDGWEDLLIVNGHVNYPRNGPKGALEPQLPFLFRNDGNGHFSNWDRCGPDDPLGRRRVGRGAAFGDLDRDGSLDALVCVNNGPAELWRSTSEDRSWIALELVGTRSNRDAIGARVELTGGPRRQIRELVCGESYFSSNARQLVFGLAGHRDAVEALVRWPSGLHERFRGLAPGGFRRLVEGSGQPSAQP